MNRYYEHSGKRIQKLCLRENGSTVAIWYLGSSFEIKKSSISISEHLVLTEHFSSTGIYEAQKTITVAGSFNLLDGEKVVLRAGESIKLEPVFKSISRPFSSLKMETAPELQTAAKPSTSYTFHISSSEGIASITRMQEGSRRNTGNTEDGVSDGVRFYHTDHLGSSSIITDELGLEISRYTYNPFGEVNPARSTGQSVVTRNFTGQKLDRVTLMRQANSSIINPDTMTLALQGSSHQIL